MLLSIYASYHWAKISKKAYVHRMAVSIILISFLSAFFPVSIAILFTFPLTFLSFPFLAYIDPIRTEGLWVYFLRISFLTIDLTAPLPLDLGRFLVAFPFFLLVNLVGTTLGYWIRKTTFIEKLLKKE